MLVVVNKSDREGADRTVLYIEDNPVNALLVVDDDRNLLEIISMRLESMDYEVTAIRDEETARQAVAAQVFDKVRYRIIVR